ncbi:hypothetical protein M3Y99_01851200 [Aphelenchoides fujianensis]|nr:hypothetical protein M3Y99_01851200 [Aphelenchoides fujianensis]
MHVPPPNGMAEQQRMVHKSLPEQLTPSYYYAGQPPFKQFFPSEMFNGPPMTAGQRQAVRPTNSVMYPMQQPNPPPPAVQQRQHSRPRHGQPPMMHSAYPSTSYQPQQPSQMPQHQPIMQQTLQPASPSKRKEIYVYNSPFDLYAMAWSTRPGPENKYRLAVGSFMEEYNNKVSIIQLREDYGCEFLHLGTFDHPYPATKLMWIPDKKGVHPDLIATTGDYLRLWSVGGSHGATLETVLDNNRSSHYCAPAHVRRLERVRSLADRHELHRHDLHDLTGKAVTERKPKGNVKTQLIAHDREVYDICFSKLNGSKDIFGSVGKSIAFLISVHSFVLAGADGSVRMFDTRHMEFSMIVFEEPNRNPLLRLQFNQQDHNYLATFAQNSSEVFIVDIRLPSIPVATLKNHTGHVNAISWAPHSSCHICTVGDDQQALIWDVHNMPRPVDDPILAYGAKGEATEAKMTVQYEVGLSAFVNDHAGVKPEAFIEHIHEKEVFKLGDFVLKSGLASPIYIDFRGLISSPRLMNETAYLVLRAIELAEIDYDYVVGVPFAALSLGSRVSLFTNKPMLMNRPQAKAYGTKKQVEGVYEAGKRALIVEDVVTTGASILETAAALRKEGLVVEDVVCVLNREQGGAAKLEEAGIKLHHVLNVTQILDHLVRAGKIDEAERERIQEALRNPKKAAAAQSNGSSGVSWRLDARKEGAGEAPVQQEASRLHAQEPVQPIVHQIKHKVCAIKLHADVLVDATPDFFSRLSEAAKEFDFVIFEDRKFADTGNTNVLQLTGGLPPDGHALAPSIEDPALKISSVLLVAEMSSEGTLTADPEYIRKTVEMAKQCPKVVGGFICQKRCADEPHFLYWTPGVNLEKETDGKGQQWRSVQKAIVEDGNDIVIVGRGITEAKDPKAAAERYKKAAWKALESRE